MSKTNSGNQTIDCNVKSCKYNCMGNSCELSRIKVEAMTGCSGCHSGDPADESLCGSYCAK